MPSKSVAIISSPDDLHAEVIAKHMADRHIPYIWFDLGDLSRNFQMAHTIDGDVDFRFVTAAGDIISGSDLLSVWWRRPRMPVIEETDDPTDATFMNAEWSQFIEHLEHFIPAKWVNSPAKNRAAKPKGYQLKVAQQVGLRIPQTLITNNPLEVVDFADRGFPLIYKGMGEGKGKHTGTKNFHPSDIDRLESLQYCPAIFQEKIDARMDIRVTAIDGVLYPVEIASQQGNSPLDWRFDHNVPFDPHILDSTVERQLLQLLERLELVYGAIDLRLQENGEYVFLEVNPNGQFLFAEILAGTPLSEKMVDFLARE